MQNRGAIANTSAQAQSDLLNSYASQKLQNEQNELNRQTSILDKYRDLGFVNEDRQSSKRPRMDCNSARSLRWNWNDLWYLRKTVR